MLYLYHGRLSVCSVKVRLVLAEKKLDWDGEILDLAKGEQHRPDYVKLNPNAVVPTLVHDGKVLLESTLIMEYLDEVFPNPTMTPTDAYVRHRGRVMMKKIDDYLHAACATITYATGNRGRLANLSPAQIEAMLSKVKEPEKRERLRAIAAHGTDAAPVAEAIRQYDRYIGDMETALADTGWIAGPNHSLADAAALPYVIRADMVGLDRLWKGRRPHVTDWYARMTARENYATGFLPFVTDADRARYDELPHEEIWRTAERALAA